LRIPEKGERDGLVRIYPQTKKTYYSKDGRERGRKLHGGKERELGLRGNLKIFTCFDKGRGNLGTWLVKIRAVPINIIPPGDENLDLYKG